MENAARFSTLHDLGNSVGWTTFTCPPAFSTGSAGSEAVLTSEYFWHFSACPEELQSPLSKVDQLSARRMTERSATHAAIGQHIDSVETTMGIVSLHPSYVCAVIGRLDRPFESLFQASLRTRCTASNQPSYNSWRCASPICGWKLRWRCQCLAMLAKSGYRPACIPAK